MTIRTLDKREAHEDVIGYLNNWADAVVIRHKDMDLLKQISKRSNVPVINAMTAINHPCEVLADLYALSKRRRSYLQDEYLFVGECGNIGLAWKELAQVMDLKLSQCCKASYKMEGIQWYEDIQTAIKGKDIICTDAIPNEFWEDFKDNQVTLEILKMANPNACLNPCPPFSRGEEVTADAIASPYFVGYEFKKTLLEIQQAILIYLMKS